MTDELFCPVCLELIQEKKNKKFCSSKCRSRFFNKQKENYVKSLEARIAILETRLSDNEKELTAIKREV